MTPLKELKEDYERRAKAASEKTLWDNCANKHVQKLRRAELSLYREFVSQLGKLMPEEAMIKALHAQIAETQRLYQTILNIEYRGKASGVELYDCVADEAVAVLDKLHASMEKPKEYQP